MSETNNLDIKALEDEVLMAIEDLYQMDIPDWISDHKGTSELYDDVQAYGYFDFGIPKLLKLKWFSRKYKDKAEYEAKDEITGEIVENAREAKIFLTRKEVIKKKVCPALSQISDDAFSIAREISPVILAIALSGTVVIPLNPLFIALISIMVTRMGVAELCRDASDKSKED